VKPSFSRSLGNGVDIRSAPTTNQQLHAYTVLQEHTKITSFEPHLHAPGWHVSQPSGVSTFRHELLRLRP
jgi:hypothetical protein